MPQKTIQLGSPNFAYDFKDDAGPLANGVGYAIGQWLNFPEMKAQAQTQQMKNALLQAQIGHLQEGPHGKNQVGDVAPGDLVRELTTEYAPKPQMDPMSVLAGKPTPLIGPDGKPVMTYTRGPRADAEQRLRKAHIDPDTLRFVDPSTPIPDVPLAEPPPAPERAPSPAPVARGGIGDWLAGKLRDGFYPAHGPIYDQTPTDAGAPSGGIAAALGAPTQQAAYQAPAAPAPAAPTGPDPFADFFSSSAVPASRLKHYDLNGNVAAPAIDPIVAEDQRLQGSDPHYAALRGSPRFNWRAAAADSLAARARQPITAGR